MDPFSLTVGIAGLLTLIAQTTSITKKYLSSAKSAKASIAALITELDILESTLHNLEIFLNDNPDTNLLFQHNSALRTCMRACEAKLRILSQNLGQVGDGRRSRYLWPLGEKEYQKAIQELRAFGQWIQFSLSVGGSSLLSRTSDDVVRVLEQQLEGFKILRALENCSANLYDAVQDQNRLITDERSARRRRAVLDWISDDGYTHKHHVVQSARVEGTGSWLLNHPKYLQWRDDEDGSNILWCCGIQGSGKTVLTSKVIDDVKQKHDYSVAFVYFDYREQDQSFGCILRCILRQVTEAFSEQPKALEDAYDRLNGAGLSVQEAQLLVIDAIKNNSKTYIIIDALDEYDDTTHRRQFINLLNQLAQINNTRIFITSRPHTQGIGEISHCYSHIQIEAHECDLKTYVCQELKNADVDDIVDESLAARIIETVITRAQGMFLLPILHLRTVLKQPTAGDMEDALVSLPNDLSGAFRETIARIHRLTEARKQLGMDTLMWICHAKDTLTVPELSEALAVRPGQTSMSIKHRPSPKVILECCQGLLTIDPVNLFHQVNARLAMVCLTYLLFDQFRDGPYDDDEDIDYRVGEYAFLSYASRYWGVHARNSQQVPAVQQLTVQLLSCPPALACSWQILRYDGGYKDLYWSSEECYSITPLHIACHFGLETILSVFLTSGSIPVDQPTHISTTPIVTAAARGHLPIVKALLHHGANPYLGNWYGNALHCAAEAGQAAVIHELVRSGMSPNSCEYAQHPPIFCTIDQDCIAAFEMLISLGADIDVFDQNGLSVLHRAVMFDSVDIVRGIAKQGLLDLDVRIDKGLAALHLAAFDSKIAIIRSLIQAGADVNVEDDTGRRPVDYAVLHDQRDAEQLLLEAAASHTADTMMT